MSRLSIDLTGDQHQRIKALAAIQGKSIKEYIIEKVFPEQPDNDEQKAWEELQSLLSSRLSDPKQMKASGKTVEQITEAALERLGKA